MKKKLGILRLARSPHRDTSAFRPLQQLEVTTWTRDEEDYAQVLHKDTDEGDALGVALLSKSSHAKKKK